MNYMMYGGQAKMTFSTIVALIVIYNLSSIWRSTFVQRLVNKLQRLGYQQTRIQMEFAEKVPYELAVMSILFHIQKHVPKNMKCTYESFHNVAMMLGEMMNFYVPIFETVTIGDLSFHISYKEVMTEKKKGVFPQMTAAGVVMEQKSSTPGPIKKYTITIKSKKSFQEVRQLLKNIQFEFQQYGTEKMKKVLFYVRFTGNTAYRGSQMRKMSCSPGMDADCMPEGMPVMMTFDNYLKFHDIEDPNFVFPMPTFDHLHFENKEKLVRSLDRFQDVDWYVRRGIQRYCGFLFFGPPGSGKSKTVGAIARYVNRNIVDIPLSMLQDDTDMMKIFADQTLIRNGINTKNTIFVFDEFDKSCVSRIEDTTRIGSNDSESDADQADRALPLVPDTMSSANISGPDGSSDMTYQHQMAYQQQMMRQQLMHQQMMHQQMMQHMQRQEEREDSKDKKSKLNLGVMLQLLDGVINYEGLMVIVIANNIENINPALYRDGRLQLYKFDASRRIDVRNIVEQFYETKLTTQQISQLPQDGEVVASTVSSMCQRNPTLDDFFTELKQ